MAQVAWSSLSVSPTSGTLATANGTMDVVGSGFVHSAVSGDTVTKVAIYVDNNAGPSVLFNAAWDDTRETYIDQTRSFALRAAVPAGTHTVKLYAETVNGASGFSSPYTINVAAPPPPPVNRATYVSQSIPTRMVAGQGYTITVTMQNSGTTTWVGGSGAYRLGSQNPGDNVTWGGSRVDIGGSVAPGASKTFSFPVTAPSTPGTYNFQWRMVQDGVEWFGDLTPNVSIQVDAPSYNGATFVSQSVPSIMVTGHSYTASVTMQNTGTTTWVGGAGNFRLGSRNPTDNTSWGGSRVDVGASVPPGGTKTFTFPITAPGTAGTYNFQWEMVQDGVGWFGDLSTNIGVNVLAPTSLSSNWTSLSVTPTSGTADVTSGVMNVSAFGTVQSGVAGDAVANVTLFYDNNAFKSQAYTPAYDDKKGQYINQNQSFSFTVPAAPGSHTIKLRATTALGADTDSPVYVINVAPPPPVDGATFVSASVPTTMVQGQTYSASVTMRNSGTSTWTTGTYQLGSQNAQDNTVWGTNRVALPTNVAPGQSVTFNFQAKAPATTGTTNFQWKMLQPNGWFGDLTTNYAVNVVAAPAPTVTVSATPSNVRVTGTQTQAVSFSGVGNAATGTTVTKLELFQNSGAGYGATSVLTTTGNATALNFSQSLNLGAGVYAFRLRATNNFGTATDSAQVFVNITNSALLGTISGIRTNAAGVPQLFGWVCQPGDATALTYKVLLDAPTPTAGGVVLTSGTANVATESNNAAVASQCGSGGHSFVVDLSSYIASYAGHRLYVYAQTASASATVSLPCAENSCTMPGALRVGMTSPAVNAVVGSLQPVFLKMTLTNYSGSFDEVGFMVNGTWVAASSDGSAGGYTAQYSLPANAAPYMVYARVRQGNTTVLSAEVPFYVSLTSISLTSPAVNATLPVGQAQSLVATVPGNGTAAVRFYANSDSLIGTATNNNGTWSASWTPSTSGNYSIDARAYDSNGQQLIASSPVPVTVAPVAGDISGVINITPPHLSNDNAGTLPGSLAVGSDGAANYGIDIVVPPGTAGMRPALSLNYSSNGSNAQQGLGWSLGGLSTIHRCPKTVAQDGVAGRISFDTADRLCLDGQRLLRADGDNVQDASYWAAGAQYRTEIEGFSRVTRLGNNGFQVEDKNGRVRLYGADANSAIAAQGRSDGQALLWALSTVRDRSGNYMTVHYNTDAATGEYNPDLIRYGGNTNAGTSQDRSVQLTYTSRSDWQVQYMGGSRNDLRSLLSHVRTYINTAADGTGGTLVRDYALNYINSATSGRSLLKSVQVSALNASSAQMESLPPTIFAYGSGDAPKLVQKGVNFDLNVLSDGEQIAVKSYIGDFTGSGYSTVLVPVQNCVTPTSCNRRAFNGSLTGWGAPSPHILSVTLDLSQLSGSEFTELLAGDLNGDGRDDIVLVDVRNRRWAYCIAQDPSGIAPVFSQCLAGGGLPTRSGVTTDDLPTLVNIDNDGRSQLVYFDSANQVNVCSYNGSISCRTVPTTAPAGTLTTDFVPIELSKQGQSDFYIASSGWGSSGITVCRMVAGTLKCDIATQSSIGGTGQGVGDLNGDGLTDLFYTGSSPNSGGLCLSKENGLDCLPMTSQGGDGHGYYFSGIVGMLGDGVNRYWGNTGGQYAVCRMAGDQEVCQPVDLSAIPSDTLALLNGQDTYSRPFSIDGSGVPASLNCTTFPFFQNGSYYQKCWITSVAISASQDRLISVTNGMGFTAEADYARGDDTTVYGRYATVADVEQRPAGRQMSTNPGVLVKQLRQAAGQGQMIAANYTYAGAMRDVWGRGSLGFTSVRSTEVATGISTENVYAQDVQKFPQVGMALSTTRFTSSCVLSSTVNILAQQTLTMPGGGSNYFPYVSGSTTTRKDLDCSDLGTTNVTNQYSDGWGNLNVQATTTQGGNRTFKQLVTTGYMTGPGTNYLAGLPTSLVTTRTDDATLTRTVNYTYNSTTGLKETETVEPGNTALQVVTSYDRSGNQFGLVNTVTQSWSNPACATSGWPEAGCVAGMSRKVSDTTYDAMGRFPVTVKNARGHLQTLAFDQANGAMISRIDANQLRTTWTVDGFGRVLVELRPDGNETRSYLKQCTGDCPFHATTAQIEEQFHGSKRIAVPQVVYRDSAGHVERSRTWGFDGTSIVTDQRYDDQGRLWEKDQPRFENASAYLASRQRYDDLNRVISVTTKDDNGTDRTTTTTYQGLIVEKTNPMLQTRSETYDVLGQLRSVLDSGAPRGLTSFTYDPFGGLKTTTDPNGNVITVDYDTLGRKTGLHDPDLGWIEYSIDPLGQIYAQASQVQRDAGQKTWMSYDLLGRMTARYDGGDFQSHWIYDTAAAGVGQLAEAYTGQPTNKDYRRLQLYDSVGRPTLVTQYLKDGQYSTATDYDTWGRLVSQTYRRGSDIPKVFNNRYNAYGYLARVDRGTQMLWTATQQDAANRVTVAALGNGLTQNRHFNDHTGRLYQAEVLSAASSARLQEGYLYDAIGNVKTRTQYWDAGGFQESFDYDTLNRLWHSQVAGQPVLTYTYDAAGNMLTKTGLGTYTYPAQGAGAYQPHAVQSVTNIAGTFGYDKNGNLLSGGGRTANWTSFDMPLTITKGASSATFYYGPEHQRVRQKRNDGDVIYAGTQEVEPVSGGGVRVKTYWPNGIGMEIDQGGTTQLNWIHVDRLGSVIAMTAEDGTIRTDSKQEYDVWGKRRSAVDNASTDDSIDGKVDNRGFTGHEMLDQLDLVHMNGRVYDPLIGKFMSGDPYVTDPYNGQNYNRYSYVLNNPTNLTDPTGYAWSDFVPVYGSVQSFGEEVGEGHFGMATLYAGMAIEEGLSLGLGAVVKGAIKSTFKAEVKHEGVTQLAKEGGEQAAHATAKAGQEAEKAAAKNSRKAAEESAAGEASGTASKRANAQSEGQKPKRSKEFKEETWEQNKAKNDGAAKCEKCEKDVAPGTKLKKGDEVPSNRGEADHKKRLADGGADNAKENGQLLCHECHKEKTRIENSKPTEQPPPPPDPDKIGH